MSNSEQKQAVDLDYCGTSQVAAVFRGPGREQYVTASFAPFQVTRAQLITGFNSQKLVARMIHGGWIETVRRGKPGREGLYDFRSAQAAYQRLRNGEEPPLLPCEKKLEKNKGETRQAPTNLAVIESITTPTLTPDTRKIK